MKEDKSKNHTPDDEPHLPQEKEFTDLMSEMNENIQNIKTSTDQYFKRKLKMFCIRWTLTLILLYFFMDQFPVIKYLVYAAIPLAAIHLFLIFYGRKKINSKLSDTEDQINSL